MSALSRVNPKFGVVLTPTLGATIDDGSGEDCCRNLLSLRLVPDYFMPRLPKMADCRGFGHRVDN
jgi:hypothetical protein